MPKLPMKTHGDYVNLPEAAPRAAANHQVVERLKRRRDRLATLARERVAASGEDPAEALWRARAYPILAVLAPVMSTHEGKIEFPGDSMCLYGALAYPVERVLRAREMGLDARSPYNDLCPDWPRLPDRAYRESVGDSGIRAGTAAPENTDETVFDPRVWDRDVRTYFEQQVLEPLQPRVVLISTVSPGHRYALTIARSVRRLVPDAIIVLGGRHCDETVHFESETDSLVLQYSSPIACLQDGRAERVVDFVVSGEGPFALDLLLRAISLGMDVERKVATVERTVEALHDLAAHADPVPGASVIVACGPDGFDAFPVRGPSYDLAELPPPYRPFAIRARFPVFEDARGQVLRTAHVMVTNACPYHCSFCSEGSSVVVQFRRFRHNAVDAALARIAENVSYGAGALFFDDSVLWGGQLPLIEEFCRALAEGRASPARLPEDARRWLTTAQDVQRLAELQWGGQLTADIIATLYPEEHVRRVLRAMRQAGCTYLYVGIESMAAEVMQHIHKNLRRAMPWADKVRRCLEIVNEEGIRVGSSVLFGLEGETRETIDETIDAVARLIDYGLLTIASPNILTYHPGTAISRAHGMTERLDYHSEDVASRPPYVYFEEAFPGVVSRYLSEEDLWHIHHSARDRWSSHRNDTLMAPVTLPVPQEAQAAAGKP